jgi:hypothetical protein
MVVVNLHEIEFLEDTLRALAEEGVRDCVAREVEGIPSHHGGPQLGSAVLGSIANLFKQLGLRPSCFFPERRPRTSACGALYSRWTGQGAR